MRSRNGGGGCGGGTGGEGDGVGVVRNSSRLKREILNAVGNTF